MVFERLKRLFEKNNKDKPKEEKIEDVREDIDSEEEEWLSYYVS